MKIRNQISNPFNVTKAVDFLDYEIRDYWVELSEQGGFSQVIKPISPMPMLILGGKGSGKTHVMRYISYPVQRIRHEEKLISGIKEDGYIGIYYRCSGMEAGRFKGKKQEPEEWARIFEYYMEVWHAQLLLKIVDDIFRKDEKFISLEQNICKKIIELFDELLREVNPSLRSLIQYIDELKKSTDLNVNNCGINCNLSDFRITATRGRLIFGIPKILTEELEVLENVLFVYLIDEFENLSEDQQKYINTLIREKQSPSSFKVGARLYGIRAYSTFCADEDNKEGSEYEKIVLDENFRKNKAGYRQFSESLIIKRIEESGLIDKASGVFEKNVLSDWFIKPPSDKYAKSETQFIIDNYRNTERPYFHKLRNQLLEGKAKGLTKGVTNEDEIEVIINNLRCKSLPIIEKVNIYLFYQDWSSDINLIKSSEDISEKTKLLIEGQNSNGHEKVLSHFKNDFLAQLRRECKKTTDKKFEDSKYALYSGLKTIIDISAGLPKNLLMTLKKIYSWALFNEDLPFIKSPINLKAQYYGLIESSEWFYNDAKSMGKDGDFAQDSIERLGSLFRGIRYSDKPSECSLSTFTVNLANISDESQRIINLCRNWSLLIYKGEQPDRNLNIIHSKFQINPMLSPRWGISISVRGSISLNPNEINAIFDPNFINGFEDVYKRRLDRMKAPKFGREIDEKRIIDDSQQSLF